MYNFAGDFIYASAEIAPKVCNEMAVDLIIKSSLIITLVFIALMLSCIGPIYKIIAKNEKELIIPVILPFIDPDTEQGFYINFAYQTVPCVVGLLVIPGTELITCVLKNNISVMAAIIKNSLENFGGQLNEDKEFPMARAWQFRNILLKIFDYNRFVTLDVGK